MEITQKERLAKLEQQMSDARKDISYIKENMEKIKRILDRAQGGYKFLVLLIAVSGSMGAMAGKILGVIKWMH